jgi:hypothetical protein
MKTTKLFLSIALVALTTAAFGHFNSSSDIVLESELSLESWMVTQFESTVLEEDLSMESWMVAPFESNVLEEDLAMEAWMYTPFNASNKMCNESGMVACCN